MVEGNGIDLGSIYGLLLEVAKTVSRHDQEFAALREQLASVRDELRGELAELRQEVRDYHGAVVGHGIHISEHEERLGRVEQHLGLPHA